MASTGKRYTKIAEAVDRSTTYSLEDAIAFMKEHPAANFDESAEIAFRLGADPTKSDQAIRGTVSLPHGTGKKVRIIVFADAAGAEAAMAAGAVEAGMDELLAKVSGGWMDFDIAIATPDAMKEVRKLGKVLGPRGLMPNPKTGTVTTDLAAAVGQFAAGRVEYRMDRQGNLMVAFGKLSFENQLLVENARAVIKAVQAARPSSTRGTYIRRVTVCSTMGPGLRLQPREYAL